MISFLLRDGWGVSGRFLVASFVVWFSSAAWAIVDQSVISFTAEGQRMTTGRAAEVTLFSFSISDTGGLDEQPTILHDLTLHVDASSLGAITGGDFAWRLHSGDVDGAGTPMDFTEVAITGGGASFALTFSGDPLLHVPHGASRALTLSAQYLGTISGEFPKLNPTIFPHIGMFFTADVDAGDFAVNSDTPSSLLTIGTEGPELGPCRVPLEQPKLAFTSTLPERVTMDTKLEVVIDVRDYYGNLLTNTTTFVGLDVIRTAPLFALDFLQTARGPIDGQFRFTISDADTSAAGVRAADRRIDFANPNHVPGGDTTIVFVGDLDGGFDDLSFQTFIETDEDSVLEAVASPAVFEASSEYTTLWTLDLHDLGTTDQMPTAIYELGLAVAVGDGCLFDARDFSWRLTTDGIHFDADNVWEDGVIFRGNNKYADTVDYIPLPAAYERDAPAFNPLLLAQDGASTTFEIQAATSVDNAALDGLSIELILRTDAIRQFAFRKGLQVQRQSGSKMPSGLEITNGAASMISIAAPTVPAWTCGGEGEGEGEGESEGEGEGEGSTVTAVHTADQNSDNVVNLSELLRVIQFFNSDGFSCADPPESTEDGYQPGAGDESCVPHASDYNPGDFEISLSELLRLIQFFNSGGYVACPDADPPTEDGYCPGTGM